MASGDLVVEPVTHVDADALLALYDDATICSLQDVLVLPTEQRPGVGRALVDAVLE
jgi:ribosomal protein S18 acetylase RimI-like enzyme